MHFRTAMALLAVACIWLGWLAFKPSPVAGPASAYGTRAGTAAPSVCTLPPRVNRGAVPLQSAVPSGLRLPDVAEAKLTPLAGFSIEARVLSREDYWLGREADFSPTDLALGWGRMRDDNVLSALRVSQGGRWYRYGWQGEPPIPLAEIVRSSANMHMIPADDAVAKALRRVERGDNVRIDGWLVQIDGVRGWRWRSSLSREDSGDGACELVFVCAVTRE